MRRVVVTGMGMITAIGCGVNDNWKNLISSTSGIKLIDSFEIKSHKTKDLAKTLKNFSFNSALFIFGDKKKSVNSPELQPTI